MARIYLVRDEQHTLVCRRRPRARWVRPVPRAWRTLDELPPVPGTARRPGDTALIFAPPVALGALTATVAPPEVGIALGGVGLIASTYLAPLLRRRAAGGLARRRRARPDTVVLSGPAERAAFDRAVEVADRISETWPALRGLVDPADAEVQLAEALWEIALILGRRAELDRALAGLTPDRPEPAGFLRRTGSAAAGVPAWIPSASVRFGSRPTRTSTSVSAEPTTVPIELEPDPLALPAGSGADTEVGPETTAEPAPSTTAAPNPSAVAAPNPSVVPGSNASTVPGSAPSAAGAAGATASARTDGAAEAAADMGAEVDAVRSARARIDAELTRRQANLRRAEQAGRDFIREQEMRRAVRMAEETLRAPSPELASESVAMDAGADLAEHTRSVLAAYRELTAALPPD